MMRQSTVAAREQDVPVAFSGDERDEYGRIAIAIPLL